MTPKRSALGAFERSRLGVRLTGGEPPGAGHILLLDVDGETLVYSHEPQAWGVLAAGGPVIQGVAWVQGVLYGWQNNRIYSYDITGDAWVAYGDPFPAGNNVIEVVDYQNGPAVAAAGFDVWRWSGTQWESIATYSLDQSVHPQVGSELSIPCDDFRVSPPDEKCISGEEDPSGLGNGLASIIVKNGELYLGGDYWADWTTPFNPALACNPVITSSNEPIAIFEQRVVRIENGPDNLLFVELATGTDRARWRDTWPGCCYQQLGSPPHYEMIEAANTCSWVAVSAVQSFAAGNVIDYFANMPEPIPFIADLRVVNNQVYASLVYSPEQVIITTYDNHGLNKDDFIEINGSERYEQAFAEYQILEVPAANRFVIDRQYRGTERCGWNRTQPSSPPASGTIVSFEPRPATPISGLYRWDATSEDWTPAFTENVHGEGIPGAYPMIEEDGPGYIRSEDLNDRYAFDYSTDGGLYFMSRAIPTGDGDSFERLDLATGISRRLCFPELTFPNPSNPFRRVQALPPGAQIGQTPNVCFGDSVTNKFVIADVDTIILQCAAPHGLDGAGSIVIQNSAPVDYDGTESILEIVSPTQIRVRETFAGTSAGEFYWEEDPNNVQNFTAVTDGGPFTYWIVNIECGTDPRPADIVLTGAQSGRFADFSGVPYDSRERVLIASDPPGQRGRRSVEYNRFGNPSGPNTTHYYRLDIPQTADPGWINGEAVIVSRP